MARTHRSTTSLGKAYDRRGSSVFGGRQGDSVGQSMDQEHSHSAHPGHVRAQTDDGRHLSSLSSWSRSNLTLPIISSQPPSASGSFTDSSSRRTSHDEAFVPGMQQQDAPESVAKSLLYRGSRVLRRQGSKFSISSLMSSEGDHDSDRATRDIEVDEICQRGHSRRSKSTTKKREALKRTISAPYNFQHVTHTHRAQFDNLDRVSKNELISEFCAIRAGQRSKTELKGIKAEDVQSLKKSLEILGLSQADLRLSVLDGASSTPETPSQPQSPPGIPATSPVIGKGLRLSRSIENFSRPAPRSPLSPLSPRMSRALPRSPISPITPPGRNSSRVALVSPSILPEQTPGSLSPVRKDGQAPMPWNMQVYGSTESLPTELDLKEVPLSSPSVGNAITTNDDSARQLRASPLPMLPTDLADVPEEEEGHFWSESDGHGPQLSLRHAQTFPSSTFLPGSNLTNIQGGSDMSEPTTPRDINKSWPTRGAPIPLGSPTKARHSMGTSRRFSIGLKPINVGAWEEDVDYCYEHAAEADSNFDWDRRSNNAKNLGYESHRSEEQDAQQGQPKNIDSVGPMREAPSYYHGSLRPPQLLSFDFLVPDLEPSSALSTSSLPELMTPLVSEPVLTTDGTVQPWIKADQYESKPTSYSSDDPVDELISEYVSSPMELPSRTDSVDLGEQSSAPRSSFSGTRESSKTESQSEESITMSIASSYAGSRASSNSLGSLPDLVHSASSRGTMDSELRHYNLSSNLSHQSYPPPFASKKTNHPRYAHSAALDIPRPISTGSETSVQSLGLTEAGSEFNLGSNYGRASSAPHSPNTHQSPSPGVGASRSPSTTTSSSPSRGETRRNRLAAKASYSLFPSTTDPRLVWS